MKKKQNKHSLGISALQIIVALSLMSMSAVLLASGFRAAPARGGNPGVVSNPAVVGGQQKAPKPAVVSPFSDEELAAQAAIEDELREAERIKQSGLFLPQMPSASPLEPEPPEGVTPALQPYWQGTVWRQLGRPVLRDSSEWEAWQAQAAI